MLPKGVHIGPVGISGVIPWVHMVIPCGCPLGNVPWVPIGYPLGNMGYPLGVIPWVTGYPLGDISRVYPLGTVIPWVTCTQGITQGTQGIPIPWVLSLGYGLGLPMWYRTGWCV